MNRYSILCILCLLMAGTACVKAAEFYATLSSDQKTMTMYYDDQKEARSGIHPYYCRKTTTKAIFDESVKNFHPSNTVARLFGDFELLETIEHLDYLDTQNVKKFDSLFINCKSLTSLDLRVMKTTHATSMRAMFYGCTNLETLNISKFETSNVTTMRSMFYQCEKLKSLDLSNFDTKNVTDCQSMFYHCFKLAALDVSKFDTKKVTSMKSMFNSCESLTSLDVSNFETSNVTDMRWMFKGCAGVEIINVNGFDVSKVTSTKEMFANCNKLTTIFCNQDWKTITHFTSSDESNLMFSECNLLTGGKGTKYNENHTDIEYARIDGVDGKPGYFTLTSQKDQAIEKVQSDKVQCTKEIQDGVIVFKRGGKTYTVQGQEVKW